MSLVSKVKHRVLELMIVKDMDRAEATRVAAKEFGRIEAIKDNSGAVPKPAISTGDASSAREQLFQKIMSIRDRMLGSEAKGALTGESPSEAVGSPPASQ